MRNRKPTRSYTPGTKRSPLLVDPSRTGGIRRVASAALRARYKALEASVRVYLAPESPIGLLAPAKAPIGYSDVLTQLQTMSSRTLANSVYQFSTSEDKVKRFREWLRKKLGVVTAGDRLIADWIEQGYRKGAARSYTELRRVMPEDDVARLKELGEREVYLKRLGAHRPTVEKVNLLASRTFHDLEGVNHVMATRMSRLLAEGLATGRLPSAIASDIAEETSLAHARSLSIVRTELVRAHAEGQLDSMSNLGQSTVTAQIEFATADDTKLCSKCERLGGRVYGVDEARGIIPVHPHCRCAWVPVNRSGGRINR